MTTPNDLDSIFEALANQHRREIVYALALQPYSISQLAQRENLSLPAIHKHIQSLENAGLVTRKKIGKSNVLTFNQKALLPLQSWVNQYQTHWGSDKENLENYAEFVIEKKIKGGDKN